MVENSTKAAKPAAEAAGEPSRRREGEARRRAEQAPATIELELRQAHLLGVLYLGIWQRLNLRAAARTRAADYIVKPFSPTELVARVRAALRRQDRPKAFVLDELRIRYDQAA